MSISPNKKFHSRKAQMSLEFIIMISLTLIVFTGFYVALMHKQVMAMEHNIHMEAKGIADRISYELDLALVAEGNFTKEITLPEKISGREYNITYENTGNYTAIFVNYEDKFAFSYSAISNLSGTLHPGKNNITNMGGLIYVN